jgi:hypothetical protein
MSEHAFLAPSSADIWGAPDGCPAYPRMAAAYPQDEDTQEAREGTAAHWYLEETLRGNTVKVGDVAPNGVMVTDEMVECAEALIADVQSWRHECAGMFVIEQRVYMPSIHPTLNWGTTDIAGVDLAAKRLRIRDYKFGHRYVDAYENLQGVNYAVGIARHFSVMITPEWTVEIGIFQPRCYHPEGPRKIWSISGARFQELADGLAYAARKATEPDAPMHTGEHCRDCSARYDCPALIAAGGASVDLSLRGVPQELTPVKAGLVRAHIVGAIARLEAFKSGVDAQIEAFIRQGKQVPGVEMKPSEGREYWTVPIEEVAALGALYQKEIVKPKALTPKQARELGIDEAVISAYSDRRKGALKVAAMDDNRAAKAFK